MAKNTFLITLHQLTTLSWIDESNPIKYVLLNLTTLPLNHAIAEKITENTDIPKVSYSVLSYHFSDRAHLISLVGNSWTKPGITQGTCLSPSVIDRCPPWSNSTHCSGMIGDLSICEEQKGEISHYSYVNGQQFDCLINSWFRLTTKKTWKLQFYWFTSNWWIPTTKCHQCKG